MDESTDEKRRGGPVGIIAAVVIAAIAVGAAAWGLLHDGGEAIDRAAAEACRAQLEVVDAEGTREADITRERVFTSAEWREYVEALEGYGYGPHTPVGDRTEQEIAETDALFVELRADGSELAWVVWEMVNDVQWQCLVQFVDGDVVGTPVTSGLPRE